MYSILALSTLLINGEDDNLETLRSGWLGSQRFHDAAERCLGDTNELGLSLPDIQALGIVSLYQLHRGEESEALEIARAFLQRISELYEQGVPLEYQLDATYPIIRDTTYSGAVSLGRYVELRCTYLTYANDF